MLVRRTHLGGATRVPIDVDRAEADALEDILQDCTETELAAPLRIPGDYHIEGGVGAIARYSRPSFCYQCGNPFPWTQARIAAAKDLADELDLPETERETLKSTIDDLSSDTPRTEVGVLRFKTIIGMVKDGAADAMRSVIVDVASEAVKKMLMP